MTYEKAIEQAAAEGAIRVFRLSDSTAYVYRLKDNQYQVRTLSAVNGDWGLTKTVASRHSLGRSADNWYRVEGLPWRAQPIQAEAAQTNPGYSAIAMQQCYTCKQFKPEGEFVRPGAADQHRSWECNECYARRQREVVAYEKGDPRRGDFLDKDTLASPPPAEGKI